MTTVKKLVASTSLVILVAASASVPAFAHSNSQDEDNSSSGSNRGHVTLTEQTSNTSSSDDTKPDDTVKTNFQNRAKQQIDDLKKTAKQKTQAARETSCTARKSGVDQRVSSIAKNTADFQAKLDSIFTKVQTYKTDKNLTVANYDSLVAAVNAAKAASATSQATLDSLKPTIDCTKDTNAQAVAAYRTAAQDSRDKLKAYMQSLKDLLKAVREAKQAASSNTGSTN